MLQLLRSRDLPWHRRVWARFRDVSGIVVIGDVHGDVSQIAGRAQPLRLDWKPLGGHDPLAWLHWKSRLAPTLVGRDRELDSLRRWTKEGGGVRARVLSGEGGTGKTRLAAELAQELRDEGWQAGFVDLRLSGDGAAVFRAGGEGTLILLDYPEEHREATRELLRDLAALETNERLRVLLLSRRGDELWRPEIDGADAFDIFDEPSLELGPLPVHDLHGIFEEARRRVPVPPGTAPPTPVDEGALATWLEGETAHRRPLFVLAAAIESALDPERCVVRLQGREVIQALARRELTRLRDESKDAGLPLATLPRLTALAAISGGLDSAALRRMASSEATLELGLPPPDQVTDRLQATGRLVRRNGDRFLPALGPDLVAAAMLVEALSQEPELAPERLWAAVEGDLATGLERLGRLAYDTEVTLGLLDERPSEWLRRALEGEPGRCSAAAATFYETRLALGLLPAASDVWRVLLGGDLEEERRGQLLNTLSLHSAAAGHVEEALVAVEEAVEIYRQLASSNPSRYERDLAVSLGNLSIRLADAGRNEEALAAIEETVGIDRRLASLNQSRYEQELVGSLNNLSNLLALVGNREEALAAIKEAVGFCRCLASSNPSRYEPELAVSLSNLSIRLAAAGRDEEALAAIKEAVGIDRRLASSNLSRYEPELAGSLNNLSNRLARAGHVEEALAAAKEAVGINRRLALSNPSRFEPELASSLNNLSNRLAQAGRDDAALAAIREAARRIERYTQRFPEGLYGRWGEIIRSTLKEREELFKVQESRAADCGLAGPDELLP